MAVNKEVKAQNDTPQVAETWRSPAEQTSFHMGPVPEANMVSSGNESPSQPPSLGRMALLALLGCGIGIGLVGGMVGFHEGGIGRGVVGFLIGAGVGAPLGLIMSPLAFLRVQSGYRGAKRSRRKARAVKKTD